MVQILLVDDEPSIRLAVGDAIGEAGYDVTLASDGQQAMDRLRERSFDLVITDIRLPKKDGLAIFRHLRQTVPDTWVILITAYGNVRDAVTAMREGADDYLTKPFDNDELLLRVQRVSESLQLRKELRLAREKLSETSQTRRLIGQSPALARVLSRVDTIASSELPVLVYGESCTGKELIALRLHEMSQRRDGPFIAVNCAAFPESLLEAELSEAIQEFERQFLLRTLRRTGGKKKQAADLLGISRKDLWEKLKGHGISGADLQTEG